MKKEIQLALAFGTNASNNFSNNVIPSSFRGINIYQHGPNPLSAFESKVFMKHLDKLTRDYPQVPGNTLHEIHLFSDLKMPTEEQMDSTFVTASKLMQRRGSSYTPLRTLRSFLGSGIGTGIALPKGMAGISQGSIGLNVGHLRNMMKHGPSEGLGTTTLVNQATGTMRRDALGHMLTHEFGHMVQFHQMKDIPNATIRAEEAGRMQIRQMDPSISEKEINESMGMGKKIAGPYLYKHVNAQAMHHADIVTPAMKKSFGTENTFDVTQMIKSDYATSNTQELFAETFTRGRQAGMAQGKTAARTFEKIIRKSNKIMNQNNIARAEKVAYNKANVETNLAIMGSKLARRMR